MSSARFRSASISGSMASEPDTWNPPMTTGTPAARSGPAMSSARGNWFDCTPISPTIPNPPALSMRRAMVFGRTRVFVSSMAVMRISTSGPRIRRAAQSEASPCSVASVLEGMSDRNHWMT